VQLYFFNHDDALLHRLTNFDGLSVDMLQILQQTLNETNPYSHLLLHALHDIQRNPAEHVSVRIVANPLNDRQCYNPPTVNEIAAIVSGDECIPTDPHDIILRQQDGTLHHISDLHPSYTPLHYVLLFPYRTPTQQTKRARGV
jgi:hypothetical protein